MTTVIEERITRPEITYNEQPHREYYVDAYESFDFQFPSRNSVSDTLTGGDASGSETPNSEDVVPTNSEKDNSLARVKQATRVFSSRYEGNAELGGTHHISLTEVHDPKGVKEPLFRWL